MTATIGLESASAPTEPGGALGEMLLHGYRATIFTTDDAKVWLELVLDFRTGVGMAMTGDGLAFTFDPPAAGDLDVTVTKNPNDIPPALIDAVFAQLTPQVFGAVQDVLPAFPLPGFAGLGLAPGNAFGPEGEGWLRWCFASRDPGRLAEGVDRLRNWLEKGGAV